jgi:hypothetical protein
MKPVQVGSFVGGMILVVGLATFLSQSLSSGDRTEVGGTALIDGPPIAKLNFPTTVASEAILAEIKPSTGFYDFLFDNPNSGPLEVGLEVMSCKCSKVEMLLLSTEEAKRYKGSWEAGATQALLAASGLLPALCSTAAIVEQGRSFLGTPARWRSMMNKEDKPIPVPPHTEGIIRLTWEGKQQQQQRLKASIWYQEVDNDKTRSFSVLEVPMLFVHAVQVEELKLDVHELTAGARRTAAVLCWSPTRAGFQLSAREENGDPCFECRCVSLSAAECAIVLTNQKKERKAPPPPPLSGYLILVTVHERNAGKQLDLGPFTRPITLTTDCEAGAQKIDIHGVVVGEVRIVGEERNLINLSLFNADEGRQANLVLESERPTLQLELEKYAPDYLQVDLQERSNPSPTGGKQWELKVVVPPNKAAGRLPADSVVVLTTKDSPPRRFRIPISGHATLR